MVQPPALKLIGYWAQNRWPSLYPHPQRLVRPGWRPGDRGRIAAYLRAGGLVAQYCGPSFCRICGKHNGSRELTDREWVWPEGLAHYVEAHSVCLPDEVIVAMESRAWQVPAGPAAEAFGPVDESFWVGWASRLAAAEGGFLNRLVERASPNARARARRREVEQDFLFYCHVCGDRRVKLNRHQEQALCSAECRRKQDVAISYLAHKSCGVTFSDREVLEVTGLRISSLPKRLCCKWCGQATLKLTRAAGRCKKCGGEHDEW
jgi:hypothetical protein